MKFNLYWKISEMLFVNMTYSWKEKVINGTSFCENVGKAIIGKKNRTCGIPRVRKSLLESLKCIAD